MFVGELEGPNKTKNFVNVAAYRQIVHGDVAKFLVAVDDEQTPKCGSVVPTCALVIDEHSIVGGDLLLKVSEKRKRARSNSSFSAGCANVFPVRMHRVRAGTNHLTVEVTELLDAIREGTDFRGAHESKVVRVWGVQEARLSRISRSNSVGLHVVVATR